MPLRLSLFATLTAFSALACGGSDATTPPPMGGGGSPPSGGAPATGGVPLTGGGGPGGGGGSNGRVFDAGSDPARNRIPGGQVCGRIATIQCAGEAYCCDAPGRTIDQCWSAQVAACNETFVDAVTANSIAGYDIGLAEQALGGFEQRASQCDPTIASWSLSTGGIRGVMRGTVGLGGNCTPLNPTDAPVAAAHLASCQNPETTACLPGVGGLSWTCDPRSAAGGPCLTDLNCSDGLYCDNLTDPPALTGTVCNNRKPNGAPCQFGQECTSLTCRGGSCVDATAQTAYCLGQ